MPIVYRPTCLLYNMVNYFVQGNLNEHFKNDGIEHFFLVIFVAALVANRFFAACV